MTASIARTFSHLHPSLALDALVDAATRAGIRNLSIARHQGKLVICGEATYQLDLDAFFEAVKCLDGWERDVVLNIAVERHDIRGYHTVQPGETLASIAAHYLGSESREGDVFHANRDRMNDPDQILAGQQLLIPKR